MLFRSMIDLPHFQSEERPKMSLHDRAAQFAPFAAITGHKEALDETARLTDYEIILDDIQVERINEQLAYLSKNLSDRKLIAITYFVPDATKEGGKYLTDIGIIKKIEQMEQVVVMDNGRRIEMKKIVEIEVVEAHQIS